MHCRVCTVPDFHVVGEWVPLCPSGDKFKLDSFYAPGRMEIIRALIEGDITECSDKLQQIVYTCTMCGACSAQCELYTSSGRKVKEMGKTLVNMWEDLRADMMRRGWGPLDAHQDILKSVASYDNAWGGPRAERERWGKGLKIKDLSKEKADVLYFVGCTMAYDPRLHGMIRAMATILDKASVDWGFLGNKEKCCGSVSLRIGDRDQFNGLARDNIKTFNDLGVSKIVTSCAGCYSTFKNRYPEVGEVDAEVLHVTEYIAQLIKEKKIEPVKEVPMKVTYHDPCHIGRHVGLYDEPRRILRAIPGIELIEMKQNKMNTWCCGAGAGMRTAYPDLATETGVRRIEQAEETGASALTSACPFCYQNLTDAIKAAGSKLKFMDLSELLVQSL
jgi:heterodisulfide reductase subunit D